LEEWDVVVQFVHIYQASVWLVWRNSNGVSHINKVKLRRAQLVLATFGGPTIPVFIWAHWDSPSYRGSVQRVPVMVLSTAGEEMVSPA